MADNNRYFKTRDDYKKSGNCPKQFKSVAAASEYMDMTEDRLGDIERGNVTPRPDEIIKMAKAYDAPQLYNFYCAYECELGKEYLPHVDQADLDLYRIATQFHNALTDMEQLEDMFMKIADDGNITEDESDAFQHIIEALDTLAARTTALKLWAHKRLNTDKE